MTGFETSPKGHTSCTPREGVKKKDDRLWYYFPISNKRVCKIGEFKMKAFLGNDKKVCKRMFVIKAILDDGSKSLQMPKENHEKSTELRLWYFLHSSDPFTGA